MTWKQKSYKGAPTAKSRLFEAWDRGDDDDDDVLASDYGVSVNTVGSYRREWLFRRGKSYKKASVVRVVCESDVPFRTSKGLIWRVPLEQKMDCDRCVVRKECHERVREGVRTGEGAYLGCECVLEKEMVGLTD